ncbi:TPA: nucleotide-binding protein [Kluyvera ascorbata]|nr:nucleotide-binding protein [Kluyvera ascorbata]
MNGAIIMNDLQIIDELQKLKGRLRSEVLPAYDSRGREFGRNRFNALKAQTVSKLNEYLPGETLRFEKGMVVGVWSMKRYDQSEAQWFWKHEGKRYEAYIDSLIIDLQNGEYVAPQEDTETMPNNIGNVGLNSKVFIIHGHDGEAKEKTARFIEKLGLEAVILSEQANQGKTIIEKLEHYIDVGFAIVLYTGDDLGNTEIEAGKGNLNARARQNVVFEHGLLMGRLGRHKVIPLVAGTLELPSDIQGVVYIDSKNWQLEIAREIKAAGYDIDMNKVL